MKSTYEEAIAKVFEDEGGYSNDAADPGGPTNWGITIADARLYWKPDATANDVKTMPKSVAEEIYRKHYAAPLQYDALNPGVDYAVLDYGINSGIYRSAKVLQRLVGVSIDSNIGPQTVAAANKKDQKELINGLYDERLAFLKSLRTWPSFGRGWSRRCAEGRKLALSLVDKYPKKDTPATSVPVIVGTTIGTTGTVIATQVHHDYLWPVIIGTVFLAALIIGIVKYVRKNKAVPPQPVV